MRGHTREGGREEIFLEEIALAGHNEGEGLYGVGRQFKHAGRLATEDGKAALWHEAAAFAGGGGPVLRDGEDVGGTVDDFVVADIAVALVGREGG